MLTNSDLKPHFVNMSWQKSLWFHVLLTGKRDKIDHGDVRDKIDHGDVKVNNARIIIEPPREKTNNVVSEQVRHKPGCTSTDD